MKPGIPTKLFTVLLGITCIAMGSIMYITEPMTRAQLKHKLDSTDRVAHKYQINYILCKEENRILVEQAVDYQLKFDQIWNGE